MGKTLETTLQINATLKENISGAMKNAQSAINALQNSSKVIDTKALENAQALQKSLGTLGKIQEQAVQYRQLKVDAAAVQNAQAKATLATSAAAKEQKDKRANVDALKAELERLKVAQDYQKSLERQARLTQDLLKNEKARLKASAGVKSESAIAGLIKKSTDAQEKFRLNGILSAVKAAKQAQESKSKEIAAAKKISSEISGQIKLKRGEYRAAERELNQATAKYEASKSNARGFSRTAQSQQEQLYRMRAELRAAGFDTTNFFTSQKQLQAAIASVNKSLDGQVKRQQELQELRGKIQTISGALQGQKKVVASEDLNDRAVRKAQALESLMPSVRALKDFESGVKSKLKSVDTFVSKEQGLDRKVRKAQALETGRHLAAQVANYEISAAQRKAQAVGIKSVAAINPVLAKIEALNKVQGVKVASQPLEAANAYRKLKMELLENKRAFESANKATAKLAREYRQQGQAVQNLESNLRQFKDTFKAAGQRLTPEQAAQYRQSISQLEGRLAAAQRNVKQAGKNFEASKIAGANIKGAVQGEISALRELSSALNAAGISTRNLASSIRNLEQNQRAAANRERFNQAYDEVSNNTQNFQNALDTAGLIMNPFKVAADNAMTYEYELSNIKALTQLTDIRAGNVKKVEKEMSELDEQFRRLGATTEYTMTQVAQGAGYLAMAGWDKQRISAGLDSFMDLATATRTKGEEFARLMDIVTDDMTAARLRAGEKYRLKSGREVESSQYFADTFAYALNKSNLNKESLHEGFKYFAPIASQMEMSVAEMMGTAMFAANRGIKGSMSGTAFRAGLLRMAAPPKTAAKALTEMGEFLSMSDAQKELNEAQDTLKELGITGSNFFENMIQLSGELQHFDKEKQAGYINAIFGRNAATFWTSVLTDPQSIKEIGNYVAFMESEEIDNYARDVASVQRDNTKIHLELLKSSIDAVSNAAGTALLPAIRTAAAALSPVAMQLSQILTKNPQLVQGLAAVAAGISSVIVTGAGIKLLGSLWQFAASGLKVFSDLIAVLPSKLMGALSILSRLAALALTPWGAGLMLLASIAYLVYKNWDSVGPVFSRIAAVLRTALQPAAQSLQAAFQSLSTAWSMFTKSLSASGITEVAIKAFIGLSSIVADVAASIVNALSGALSGLTKFTAEITYGLKSLFEGDFGKATMHFGAAITKSVDLALDGLKRGGADLARIPADVSSVLSEYEKSKLMDAREKYWLENGGRKQIGWRAPQVANPIKQSQWQAPQIEMPKPQNITVEAKYNVATVEDTLQVQQAKLAAQIRMIEQERAVDFKPIGYEVPQMPTLAPPPNMVQLSTANWAAAAQNAAESAVRASISALNPMFGVMNVLDLLSGKADAATPESVNVQAANESINQLSSTATQAAANVNESLSQISTTALTANEGLTQAAANVQATNESLSQISTTALTANEGLNQTASTVQSTNESFNQVSQESTNLTASYTLQNAAVQALTVSLTAQNAAAQMSVAALNNLSASIIASVGSVSTLSNSSASAASSVAGLGYAAQSAISAMNSAAANISVAAANLPVAKNAKGGIYNHGAFLTWFAEKSPEAAIPLDGSDRAIGLWLQAGQMLGLEPAQNAKGGIYQKGGKSISPKLNIFEELFTGIDRAAKILFKASQNFIDASRRFDELGNIIGLNGLPENVITAEDSRSVVAAKKEAQLKEYRAQNSVGAIIMTPSSVKAQQSINATLQRQRESTFSNEIKQSKSYETLQRVERASGQSVMSPQAISPAGAIDKLLKGDIWGAVKGGIEIYKRQQEIEAGAPERPKTLPPVLTKTTTQQPIMSPQAISPAGAIDKLLKGDIWGAVKGGIEIYKRQQEIENAPQIQSPLPIMTANLVDGQMQGALQNINALDSSNIEPLTQFDEPDNSENTGGDTIFNFTINVQGENWQEAFPQIQESFEEQMRRWQREQQRRSYK